MKLESSVAEISTNLKMESIQAELAADKLHKMWDLLQSPYKDPISAVVREYVSNAYDSHIEAGVDDAIYVSLDLDSSGYYFACEDFGVGISPERATKVFMRYLSSTKEDTNEQIGAFGMGSKSGLGYTDVVHISTRFGGIEYTYLLHKTKEAPSLTTVSKTPTDKRNGTRIKIYLKDDYYDLDKFRTACAKQLAYFDNIYFAGQVAYLNKDFKVIEGDSFVYRPGNYFTSLHLVIGNVYYPIDFSSLNIPPIDIPFGIRFDIGDLPVIFTREDIRYTDNSISLILERIEALKKEIISRAYPSYEIDSLEELLAIKTREFKFWLDSEIINISSIVEQDFEDKFYLKDNPYLIPSCYSSIGKINFLKSSQFKVYKKIGAAGRILDSKVEGVHSLLTRSYSYFVLLDGNNSPKTNRYIRENYSTRNEVLLLKRRELSLEHYISILKLKRDNRDTWRFQINWLQEYWKKFEEDCYHLKYSDVEVPESFEKKEKEEKDSLVSKLPETVYGRVFRNSDIYFGEDEVGAVADYHSFSLTDLKSFNLIIYGSVEDEEALKCTYRLLNNFNVYKFRVLMLSQRGINSLLRLHEKHSFKDVCSLDEWYMRENKLFEAFVFMYKYQTLVNMYENTQVKYSLYRPLNVPYEKYYNTDFTKNLPIEFIVYLVKLFKLQGRTLDLERFSILRKWYKLASIFQKLVSSERLDSYPKILQNHTYLPLKAKLKSQIFNL
jgi:hypothetical protein